MAVKGRGNKNSRSGGMANGGWGVLLKAVNASHCQLGFNPFGNSGVFCQRQLLTAIGRILNRMDGSVKSCQRQPMPANASQCQPTSFYVFY
jgi:hypothetical protein